MRNDAGPLPVILASAAIFVLSAMDALIKELSTTLTSTQTAQLRYLFGAAAALVVFLARRRPIPGWVSIRGNAIRALFMSITALSFFYAVSVLPLAEAVALSFMAPLFMAFIARWLLGEAVKPSILVAILLGLAGVLVILKGKITIGSFDGRVLSGIGASLLSAVTYATAIVLVRRQTARDPVETIVFLSAAIGSVFLFLIVGAMALIAPTLGISPDAFAWRPIDGWTMFLVTCMGIAGTGGHLLLTAAYARATAARLGVLEYTAFLWAALFGLVFFGEMPTLWTLIGSGLIIAGCLIAARKGV